MRVVVLAVRLKTFWSLMKFNPSFRFAVGTFLICLSLAAQSKPAQPAAQQPARRPAPAQAQAPLAAGTTGVHGQVLDQTGALIPGATVSALATDGASRDVNANEFGQYSIRGLQPGKFNFTVFATGFATATMANVELAVGVDKSLDFNLLVATAKQEVRVEESNLAQLSVDAASNVGAIVIKGTDLDALSDDPDDMQSDLEALAGPSAGPNGGQIYIDGFTGGRLPPKESIREIRINSNPFSAEFDRLGFGRIEIFTKPGSDKYRGSLSFNYGNSALNTRNPFDTGQKPVTNREQFGGNFSGPLSKRASFFVDIERRDIRESELVNATVLDASYNQVNFNQSVVNPSVRTTISPRLDYQINKNNSITLRYGYTWSGNENQGVGGLSLPTQAQNTTTKENNFSLTETMLINSTTINETRYQLLSDRNGVNGGTGLPTISVGGAFTGGGAGVGYGYTNTTHNEVSNFTSFNRGKHFLKVGARLRTVNEDNFTQSGYNGSFSFSSIGAYQITEMGLAQGLPFTTIRASGGGAVQYSINSGQSLANVSQYDMGLFIQDEWRLKQNFSLSLGGRYETQNNMSDHGDFAPRVAFAWGLGTGRNRTPKTVVRGGFGVFYDRFSEANTLNANRLNGTNQLSYQVANPNFFFDPILAPNALPTIASLSASTPSRIYEISNTLKAPRIGQAVATVERQLPHNTTLSVNYTFSRGLNELRSRNINAPLPTTGLKPNPALNAVDLYESSGSFRQNQVVTNVNTRFNSKVSLFGFYAYGRAYSNTDSANTFPSNQYDESTEWGRANFNVRHRGLVSGSMTAPYNVRLSPFITMSSGTPYNIISGPDLNGDLVINDRPAFIPVGFTGPACNGKIVVGGTPCSAFGFIPNPTPGMTIIPRNYGTGPGNVSVNLRLSRTWGFGEKPGAAAAAAAAAAGGDPQASQRMAQMAAGGGRPGGGGPGGGGGGPRGGGGGPRGGGGGPDGGGSALGRYNLTLSVNARNMLNHVNLGNPISNLSSPLFGQSTSLGGGGGFGGGGASANRRLDLSLRFTF